MSSPNVYNFMGMAAAMQGISPPVTRSLVKIERAKPEMVGPWAPEAFRETTYLTFDDGKIVSVERYTDQRDGYKHIKAIELGKDGTHALPRHLFTNEA